METLAKKKIDKPFHCLTFQAVKSKSPRLLELWTFFIARSQFTGPDIEPTVKLFGTYDIPEMAKRVKADFDKRPDGTRYLQYNMLGLTAVALAEKVAYLDTPIAMTKGWITEFLKEYKDIDGKLDGIIVDIEYTLPESRHLYNDIYRGVGENQYGFTFNDDLDLSDLAERSRMIYHTIVSDPRYQTRIRPRLVERGFKFWPNPTQEQTEIWGICPLVTDPEYAMCTPIWDNVIKTMVCEAINESTYEPLKQYYPDAILSDYQCPDFRGWIKHMNDIGKVRQGNQMKAGNSSNFNTYSNRISDAFYVVDSQPVYRNVPGYNKAVFGKEPFNMTLWDANLFKTIYSVTDTGRISSWIAGSKWSEGNICTTCNTPYYSESVFHMSLLNMDPLMAYITERYEKDHYELAQDIIGDILEEMTRVAGYSDRKPIQTPATWNGNYVLSGMYAGGRNIWRLTPNTVVKSLADFKVKDEDPTFAIDGLTITFPQGRIMEDGNVRSVGTCGYWIETPADVMPVITSEADRYSKYPALEENFAQYCVGTEFTSETALPEKCWEVTGSALKIEENGGGKALALTGTVSVQNVKLPQNVTAGDSFAKQQAWEISFTLPENLNGDAELELLSCNNNGGIKIADGKLYYWAAGDYRLLEGVALPAGKYTVKRELDLRAADAFTSNYAVFDADGKLLGEVKTVPMTAFQLPVTSIGIACANVGGKVLVSDYKLYPTGVTLDFEIYGALLGYKLDDVNQVRTEDTAYRLSWMNTTNEQKVAYVYDVKSGAVIEKVEMAPCQDGVATGVVEVKAGTSVQLAVKADS